MSTRLINDLNIFYLTNFVEFDPTLPVLFCFHGNSSIAETFYRILELTRGFLQVIAPDLPGCGRSSRMQRDADNPYSMQSVGEIMSRFVRSFNTDPALTYFFGHSLGGHLIAYLDCPVTNIVLAGTPPLSSANDFAVAFAPDAEAVTLLPFLSSPEQFSPEIARRFVGHTGVTGNYLDLMCRYAETTDGLFRSGCLSTLADKNQFAQIQSITNVVIIHATSDGVINLDYLKTISEGCLFERKIHVVPGYHMSPILQAEEVVGIIRRAFNL